MFTHSIQFSAQNSALLSFVRVFAQLFCIIVFGLIENIFCLHFIKPKGQHKSKAINGLIVVLNKIKKNILNILI